MSGMAIALGARGAAMFGILLGSLVGQAQVHYLGGVYVQDFNTLPATGPIHLARKAGITAGTRSRQAGARTTGTTVAGAAGMNYRDAPLPRRRGAVRETVDAPCPWNRR